LYRLVRNLQQDPDVRWDLMTAQEQEQLKEKRYAEVMAQRDQEGRSANRFMQRVMDLVVSCVGEKAMFGFLLQSHKARKKVLGLLEEFCRLDEDGKLRLVASGDGDGDGAGAGG
jgi:predicted dinucleotide-utilizing enzyme